MAITQQQAIKKLVRSLTMTTKTGVAALDESLRQFGYTSFQALENRLLNDHSNSRSWTSTSAGLKFLSDYCGIRLNNNDVGAITGSDAGGSIEKTAASIVPETTAAAKLTSAQYKSFTKNGLKVNITYADTYYRSHFDDETVLLNKEKLIVRNLYSWWIGDALKLVNDSLGVNFTDGRASVKELNVVFEDNNYSSEDVNLSVDTDMGRASKLTLTINLRNYTNLKSGDKNGANNDDSAVYLDRQIADALAEATLAANINYFYDLPEYVQTGLIGLVAGLDDRLKSDLSDMAYSFNYYYNQGWQASGYTLLRYLAKQVAKKTGASSVSYNLDKTGASIEGPFQGTWDGTKYAATVKKIDASKNTKKIIIKGNKQANTILAGSGGSEIYGGKGNDIIYGGSGKDVFSYASGDGNDVIGNYASGKDMIRITSGKLNKATVSGNDVLLQVGSGNITIKNAKGKKLSIAIGKKAAAKTYIYGSGVKTQQAVILQLVESLASTQKTGTAAMDEALKQFGYTSFQALENRLLNDHSNSRSWTSTSAGLKFLTDYCGIRLNNNDVGAITGSDAGGFTEKTAASIVPESIAAVKLTAAQYKSFTKNGLKVNITYSDDYNSYHFDDEVSFRNKQKLIVRNLYSWWIGDALKLVNDSLGINFTDGRASVKMLNVVFEDNNYSSEAVKLSVDTDMGRASKLTMTINLRNYTKLKSGDKNGVDDYGSDVYLDRQIADALAEATLAANVNYFYDLPSYVQTGLIGLVAGLDDRLKSDLSDMAYSFNYYYSQGRQASGYTLLRYLARQAAKSTLPANLTNTGDGQTVTAKAGFKGTFNAGEYSSTVKTINVSAAKKAVTIKGNNNANVIRAGLGGGNYYGMKGTDTLYGNNKAKDTFWYGKGDGNDTIYDYKSGQDTIRLSSGTLLRSSVSGRNVILDMGSGKITIAGAKGKKITLIDAKGKKTTKVYGQGSLLAKGVSVNAKNTAMTLKAPFTGTVNAADYTDTIKSIDAGKAGKVTLQGGTTNIKLIGSAKADVLKAGKGGATLDGGKGSDKLYGGAGKDKFIFRKGYGTDTVFGSAKGDIAYLYNINNIKQVKKFSLKKGVLSLSFTNSKDVFTVNGWSAGGMNTFVLSNGAKYQLKASGSKVTAKRI